MIQFLSINFVSWISSIFVVFQKFPFFLCHPVHIAEGYVFGGRFNSDTRDRIVCCALLVRALHTFR